MFERGKFESAIDRAALKYLERFDASVQKLRLHLMKKARTLLPEAHDASVVRECIDELLARYQRSGLIDDARYAEAAATSLRGRGLGQRAIQYRLSGKGLDARTIDAALSAVDAHAGDAELEAARRFLKRRRLGPHRTAPVTSASRKKDLMALARAGFAYDTARRALGLERLEDDDSF